MSKALTTSCSNFSVNSYSNVLKAKCGISTNGVDVLDRLSNFQKLDSLVAVSGQSGPINSIGTKYKQIGDIVHLVFNVSLTYTNDGSSVYHLTIGDLPLPATPDGVWMHAFNYFETTNNFVGRAEVKDKHLVLSASATDLGFVDNDVYTIRGEIIYKTSIPKKCIPCRCFYKKNKFFASTGIMIDNTLLTNYTNWTPIVLEMVEPDITIDSQISFYRIFGDMVHINFFIFFRYDVTPVGDELNLKTLPLKALTNSVYMNNGSQLNTRLSITTEDNITVTRTGGPFLIDTQYIISGQIVYNATSV